MGKKKSWVQLFLVWIMLFQYGSSTIYAVANEENQSLNQSLHMVKASEEKNSDRKQVETLLEESGIEKDSYTIQEPIALFSVTKEDLVEEHYYPVLSQKKLAVLIRYAPKTESYTLEAEQVVKELADYQGETKNTAPLVLLEVEQQIVAKDEKSVYNFSTPEMSESETERLFLQADVSKINLSNTMDLYEVEEEKAEEFAEERIQVSKESSSLELAEEDSETSVTREVSEESQLSETNSEVRKEQSVTEKKTDDSKVKNKKTTEKERKSDLRNLPLPLELSRLRQNNSMFAQSIQLPLNQSSSGNISLIGEKKYYQFEIPERQAGTVYDKYTMYTTSNFDSHGTLYDSGGRVLGSNDDGNGNLDFKIVKENLQPGTYYLEVRAHNNIATGSYVVRIDRELGKDENYDCSTAVQLSLKKDYQAGIDFKGDKDYYRIEIPERQAGTVYDKYTMYTTSNFDSHGTLYDSGGRVLGSNDDGNGNLDFKIVKENLQPGTYYLEVRAHNNIAMGSYVVRIDTEETLKQKPIRINSMGSYSNSIRTTDKDQIKRYEFFIWDKPQGTVFREHEFSFKSNLFGTMTLLDANQQPITSISHNGQALDSIILKELHSGKYYLEVKTQGNFSFKINEQNISNDSNRSFKEAKLLIKDHKITETIDFGEVSKYTGDEDYFKLFIPSYDHGKYTIQLSGDTEVMGQLYNDQEELISRDFKNTLTKKLNSGIYYVKVRGKNANVRGSYQVSFTAEDAFEEAINLPTNETVQDDLSVVKGAKYYKFQISDVQKLEFYLANSAPTTIEVYDQNYKKMIGKTWETTNHKVSGTFLPGTYYIKIASKKAAKYKLLIDTVKRTENQIELVRVGMNIQVHLNGVASPELTQFYYKRFVARSLLLPGSFSVVDFMKGLVTEWTINTGGVQILDALFGTDRTGYLKDWQGKSKEYVLGLYVGDTINLVQGAVTLVGAGMFLVGGNLMGIAGAPFTGGASLTICAVSTSVTVAAATQGSAMMISAAKNIGDGHQWDSEISEITRIKGIDVEFKPKSVDKAFGKHGKDFGDYSDGSKASLNAFIDDIRKLIDTGTQKSGTWKGVKGTHIYDSKKKNWVFINEDKSLNTAFKLSEEQFKYLLETGIVK